MDRRYLIVDDNRAFAENLGEILRDLGDRVSIVDSGERALVLARHRHYHALVTDMRMPVMSGAQLVRQIRRVDPALPAVVVTAHVAEGELVVARSEGLLAVLPKPVPIGPLLDIIGIARRDGLVVIVEDDERMSDNLCEALRARGFGTVTAATVLETEQLAAPRPFLALVDLHVPGGPAGEAMLRLAARYPGLPAVVITGHSDPPPVPCRALFRKPFRTEELLAAVEHCHADHVAAAG
jgi:CheY-like chemotaxis protein